jgi:hypothetical protein
VIGSSRPRQIRFSRRDRDGAIVRGVLDCVVDRQSNAIEVRVRAGDALLAERLFAKSSVHVRVVNGS